VSSWDHPITSADVARDVRALGVRPDDVVLLHSSLRAVAGPKSMVVGGAVAILEALQDVLADGGTLVTPAFSADHSEPAHWTSPPVPETWWPVIRELWPAFRTDRTPTFRIGIVPETFRCMEGVLRSDHPQSSFCAWGTHADAIVAPHPLGRALGEAGPLSRLHELDARVLMLGTGWSTCTAFHLAEDRCEARPRAIRQGAPVMREDRRTWVEWDDLDFWSGDFADLGESFEAEGSVALGMVGRAATRLFRLRDGVDFAVGWLGNHRVHAGT